MEFRLLGPVEVFATGTPLPLGHNKQRAVLAVLAIEANRVVGRDHLIDRVWGSRPPKSAENLLYGYVGRLRHLLSVDGQPPCLNRKPGGYLLSVAPDRIDLHHFRLLTTSARTGNLSPEQAITRYDAALALWTGSTLTGMAGDWLTAARQRIDDERLTVQLERNDLVLRLHRGRALIGDLRPLAREHPLNERVAGQLMIALHQAGQAGEALSVFAEARHCLREELGLDPSPWLRNLEQRILAEDGDLVAPVPTVVPTQRKPATGLGSPAPRQHPVAGPAVNPVGPAPRQLPKSPDRFTGRIDVLTALDGILAETLSDSAPTPGLVTITGMPGIGKTAAALYWAHQVRHDFPDGDLFADLRGSYPSGRTTAAGVLARFLHALAGQSCPVPADLDEAAALYRTLMAGRRMLIVLDDAGDAEHVRTLLPATPGSLVIATSRHAMPGLAALDGARTIVLDPLPDDDAMDLLQRTLSDAPAAALDAAADGLLRACAGLPLALRIALAGLRAPSAHQLADYVAALNSGDPLSMLSTQDDQRAALRPSFARTYATLSADLRRTFRVFGNTPARQLTVEAVADLLTEPPAKVRGWLDALADVHMLRRSPDGRFAIHDLLQLFAAEQVFATEQAGVSAHRNPRLLTQLDRRRRRTSRRREPVPIGDDGRIDKADEPPKINHPDHPVDTPWNAQQI